MTWTVRHELSDVDRDTSGWLFGIPNPFPFDIFGRSIFEGWNPFPRGTGLPNPVPAPTLPVVIGEIPSELEVLQEEQRRLEDIIADEPFVPIGTVVLDESVIVGDPFDIGVAQEQVDDDVGEDEVAHDWGHLIRQGIGELTGIGQPEQVFTPNAFVPPQPNVVTGAPGGSHGNGGDCDGMTWAGGAPPKGYKVVRDSCGNGVLRKVRRRRRRRMLTSGDKDDIASIVSMVGKGQMAAALINGSMRRG